MTPRNPKPEYALNAIVCAGCKQTIYWRSRTGESGLPEGMSFKQLDDKARTRYAVCRDCERGEK